MVTITLETIKSFNPCEDGLENFIKHHKDFSGSPLDLLELGNVSSSDKFWLLFRDEFIPENDLHEIACKFAESVLHIYEEQYPNDQRPLQAIEAKRKFIKGEISEKKVYAARAAAWDARDAAEAAAWNAAGAAARAAAWAAAGAARAAARAAAGAAAWDAAGAAARAAAWDARAAAAGDAAWAAAEQKQLEIVKNYFKGKE
jgi:hypothetical protein